ncbi:hypothetical protein ASPBRDRAFT_46154, partial [Aspergillus brasiliensis CBS 101740]
MFPGLEAGEVKEGCDFIFRLAHETATLGILLLTPSSIEPPIAQETTSRLRQFSALPSRINHNAVAFLLSETPFHSASGRYRIDGLVALQALYEHSCYLYSSAKKVFATNNKEPCRMIESLPSMLPIIPVAEADCFLTSVQEYITNLEAIHIPQQRSADTMAYFESSFFST